MVLSVIKRKNGLNVSDDSQIKLAEARFVVCSETMTVTMTKSEPTKGIIQLNNLDVTWSHRAK